MVEPFRLYDGTAVAAITLKNVPDSLLGQLRERAEADRRSLNQEILYLLEEALKEPTVGEAEERARAERLKQAEEWSRLAGLWQSDVPVKEEIEAIYAARTEGRKVDL